MMVVALAFMVGILAAISAIPLTLMGWGMHPGIICLEERTLWRKVDELNW